MARPRKCKRICDMPNVTSFYGEIDKAENNLVLTLEEYEVIRLIDKENLNQEDCALQMEVSRPTVQLIYNKARKKIAEFIVNGGHLKIEGGDYKICDRCSQCKKRRCAGKHDMIKEGVNEMKLGIPVNEDKKTICMSFGRAPLFCIYNLETEEKLFIDNSANAAEGGAGIKAAQALLDNGVGTVLTPRCGENSGDVFKAAGVEIYKTQGDLLDDNLKSFQEKKLELLTYIHPGFHGVQRV